MKEWFKKNSPFVMLAAAFTVFLAAFLLGERVPEQLSLALFTLGGVLMGFGVTGIALSTKGLTPEEQKEMERGERDERNVAIREKAAMSSWYWTLYMLWAAFMVIQIFVGGLWGVAISVAIVLHCTFYMVNIHRWNKRM